MRARRGRTAGAAAFAPGAPGGDPVRWHDLECSGYEADLPLWRELAAGAGGPVLELGCGTGRIALDLAARGHPVSGLDSDPALVGALAARAGERGLSVDGHVADVRSFDLRRAFDLAIAPMQLVQLLGGTGGRRAMLSRVRRHLSPGGLLAATLAEPLPEGPLDAAGPLPDVAERDGWVFSSTPVAVRVERDGAVAIERLRQAVCPAGELSEELVTVRLDPVTPGELTAAALELGFRARPARRVPSTEWHVGATVVVLEAA